MLGADYFGKGALRPATEELLKAVELNPENADAHNLLGLVFLRQAADSEELIDRASCLRGEGAQLERQEVDAQFRKAEDEFRKATSLRPSFSESWNNLAVVAMHFQRWDDAISIEGKALSNITYAEQWAAQGNLGWAYYQKRDLLRATKELRQALFANPKFCVGRYRLAKVYAEQQAWDQSMEELTKLTQDKACPIQEAFHLEGLVALKRAPSPSPEDRALAAEMFRRCVELAPQSCLAKQCRVAD